jgi:hypothetical protein
VGPSLRRATSLSLGSVCVGSLTVALIATVRTLVQLLNSARVLGTCMAWLIDWVLASVEAAFRNFNRWAFVFVGTWVSPVHTWPAPALCTTKGRRTDSPTTTQTAAEDVCIPLPS